MRIEPILLALTLAAAATPSSAIEWNTPEAKARWAELGGEIFGKDAIFEKTDGLVRVEAPEVAHDAAIVPVTLAVAPEAGLKALDLVIDQNPSPLAARVEFGPAGDSRQLKLRVRVDSFTNMHAVAETADGKLFENTRFVKASGGCSAPVGVSEGEATAGIGEMKMKFATSAEFSNAQQATLMIRHPNFNGMQMDQDTRAYTPARFIKSIVVKQGDQKVFSMTSDISLSTDPVILFLYRGGDRLFTVTVVDTADATWTRDFEAPQSMN